MLSFIFKRFSDRPYKKFIKRSQPTIDRINELEEKYQRLSDAELKHNTVQFRERLEAGEALDDILPEAFATVKNAARRMAGQTLTVSGQKLDWNMVHYDVQLLGGLALHQGKIAEMATGEGKTLVATLPLYLNALPGRGCHCVTVNDYLARRDSEWMGHLYEFLGLTVGCIQNSMPLPQKKEMYQKDITYGTASEFGFDYLRDNGMAMVADAQVQRDHVFCIVDEVDSILVDEARTPLIISGPAQITRELPFMEFKPVIERLVREQNRFCNQLVAEAKAELEADKLTDEFATSIKLLQVRMGMPKNKQLSRMMEEGPSRKMIEKADLEMHNDFRKEELYKMKEELFYVIDEKQHQADLTEKGRQFVSPNNPDAFVLPDLPSIFSDIDKDASKDPRAKEEEKAVHQEQFEQVSEQIHTISQMLRAYSLYEKDVEYVVQDNKVQIVDENTGRIMPGRRWSEGLHQAVEAKEGVKIDKETQTLATITIQNYFRLYDKLSGMTGTAETEAAEFHDIYKLDVLPIPTNAPNVRVDENDQVFKTRREKFNAVISTIEAAHGKGQPCLVGTASVEASETLARMLKRAKIPHAVLNAKFHEQEAEIVSRAGQRGAVTVSTNMAGRGTDIKLGEGVPELGGLFVIGTERHESRRIDRQLRGRCARQGDPGRSQFFISFEDDLMRNFAAADRMTSMMERFGMQEGEALEHSWLNKSVETAQKRVEQRNYTWRKRVLDFDDVMNMQREVVYGYRNEVLTTEVPRDLVDEIIDEAIGEKVKEYLNERDNEVPDYKELINWANSTLPIRISESEVLEASDEEAIVNALVGRVKEAYEVRTAKLPMEVLDQEERRMMLVAIDKQWQEHLYNMDALREGVSLRAQGQKDPLIEYKNEAYNLFVNLMSSIKQEALSNLFRSAANLEAFLKQLHSAPQQLHGGEEALTNDNVAISGSSGHIDPSLAPSPEGTKLQLNLPKRKPSFSIETTGRNATCPCGSGKKYKNCCGREA
ncbi:MAG: preprotein translocase subunit SecA [Verrucomicrobiae bacterium]|nr:preprotein translocase subunit SecA [Verrucomicrobiae bacterium]